MALLVITLAILFTAVQGYGDGSPSFMCPQAFARHGDHEAQTSPPPASITLSTYTYNPGDIITVTLAGTAFEGFQIRAQRAPGANDLEEIVGEFTAWPQLTKPQAWMPQPGVTYNCITQAEEGDFTSLQFTWKAPTTSVGNIVFRAGIAEGFETFWDNIVSAPLVALVTPPADNWQSTVNTDFNNFNFADACGKTKGCLKYPSGCSGDACDYVVAYEPINSDKDIKFEMSAVMTEGYLSVGFSPDTVMGNELTVNCMRSGDALYVEHAYDRHDFNIRQRITDLSEIHISSTNGRIYCSFTRATSLTYVEGGTTTSKTSDLNKDIHLMVAFGDVYKDRGIIKKHTVLPIISRARVSLLKTKTSSGTMTPALLAVHIFFGMLSYFLLNGFGMIMARHYRKEMAKRACGEMRWFQIHRISLGIALGLGLIAIILIIVYIEGWNPEAIATVHGIFGLIATALMIANCIWGIKKPKFSSPMRKPFNWVHRIFGLLAYIFTIICFLLGSNVELLSPDLQLKETIIIAVGFGLQIIIEVSLEIMACRKSNATTDVAMKSKDDEKGDEAKENADKPNKKSTTNDKAVKMFFLGFYAVVAVAIVIASAYFAFMI